MNIIAKKILTFAAATIIATTSAFAASAEYYFKGGFLGHSTDEWKYGNEIWYQYSNFLCKKQTHTATAVIVHSGIRDQVRKTAKKEKWAKAQTDWYLSYQEYNSYFNHSGELV